ncbi:glycine cleavage system H-protein subunit [Xanthoria calcicola]
MAAIVRRQVASKTPSLSCAVTLLPRTGVRTPAWRSQPNKTSPSPFNRRGFRTSPASYQKRYTKDHEWIELSDDKTQGTIGITHYAASALGDVVYVELPTLDLQVSAGDGIGAVESVKSASDIMTPVTGKIIATNEKLEEKPSTINQGPEGEGWIARIEIEDAKQVESLMDLDAYRKHTEE